MALPPFLNSTGLILKIFEKIQQAKVPERYTTDFQGTVLGYGSGSARPFLPFLKRLGFLESDGRPTELYKRFRNSDSSGAAMAQAMRIGYPEIFQRNEYAYNLSDDKLRNLVVEITGREPSDGTVGAIVGSFKALKQLADFDAEGNVETTISTDNADPLPSSRAMVNYEPSRSVTHNKDLRLAYTININLPESTDVEVFNAIFSAIKANLLTND